MKKVLKRVRKFSSRVLIGFSYYFCVGFFNIPNNGFVLQFYVLHCVNCDWWEAASFYQIYPRSFKDNNNDGIGDLRGIAEKMDYLKDVGITATWLSPIYKSPNIDYGYDISDFYDIGEEYGTMADFDYLITRSNETGVKVIMDFVPNHTSDEHEWFQRSINGEEPYSNYYIWNPGKVNPNNSSEMLPPSNWQSIGYAPGSAWTWNSQRKAFYYHQFAVKQPDLNFREQKVHEEMLKVMKFWLDKGIAGFRVDAITHMYETIATNNILPDEPLSNNINDPTDYGYLNHIHTTDQNETFELVYEWREFLDNYKETNGGDTKILMTESYSAIEMVIRYYKSGDREGAQLPFNFELMKQLDSESNAHDVVKAIYSWLDAMPEGHFTNWVLGNHDGSRIGTRMGQEKIDIFSALVTLLPGTSVTYYGDEIGMKDVCVTINPSNNEATLCESPNESPFIREFCRSPFLWDDSAFAGFSELKSWLPITPNFQMVNLKLQMQQPQSHYNIYKRLLELRKLEAGREGNLTVEAITDSVLVIRRDLPDTTKSSLIALLNFSPQFLTLNSSLLNNYPKMIKVQLNRYGSLNVNGSTINLQNLQLAPYDLLVATYNSSNSLQLTKISMLLLLIAFKVLMI